MRNIWWKVLPAAARALRTETERMLNGHAEIPPGVTTGRTILIYKKGDSLDPLNYRPIACLNTCYKVMTAVTAGRLLSHLVETGILPDEQRARRSQRRGTWDYLSMDALMLDARVRKVDLNVAWYDFRKAYDLVPHAILKFTLQVVGAPEWLGNTVAKVCSQWRTRYEIRTKTGKVRTEMVSYKRGLFQGDSLAPVLFTLAIAPISHALSQVKGHKLCTGTEITHVLYMDDLKTYTPTEAAAVESLNTVCRVSKAVGMELGHAKCATARISKGRDAVVTHPTGPIPALTSESTPYKYLGLPQITGLSKSALKAKARSEFPNAVRLIWKSDLNTKHKIVAYNRGPVAKLRYTIATGVWSDHDLRDLEREARNIMRQYKSWYYNQAVERFNLPLTEGGLGLIPLKSARDASIISLAKYVVLTEGDSFVDTIREGLQWMVDHVPTRKCLFQMATKLRQRQFR